MNLPEELMGIFIDSRHREQVYNALENLAVPYAVTEYSERYKMLVEVDEANREVVTLALQQIEGGM